VLAREQRLELQLVQTQFQFFDLGAHFGRERFVLSRHFQHRRQITGRSHHLGQRFDDAPQSLELADDLLGLLLVGPEVRLGHLLLDRGHAGFFLFVVKDCLATEVSVSESLPRGCTIPFPQSTPKRQGTMSPRQ
jgi:hypothetical protein